MKTLTLMATLCIMFMLVAGIAVGKENPVVVMETSEGTMEIELYPDKAPITVQNFLWYVDNGFYEGLIFHRVIKGFMIQGGGFNAEMVQKTGNAPIDNEANNGVKNEKYTIAMARTNVVNSATSQFFINSKDNDFLNFRAATSEGFGYCAFGKVIKGMDVADTIEGVPTGNRNGMADVPKTAVTIKKAYRKGADTAEKGAKAEKKSE